MKKQHIKKFKNDLQKYLDNISAEYGSNSKIIVKQKKDSTKIKKTNFKKGIISLDIFMVDAVKEVKLVVEVK